MPQALAKNAVDVFLLPLNQLPAEHTKALGTLTRAKNAVVSHWVNGVDGSRRIKIGQRNGFWSFPVTGHKASTGASTTPAWGSPQLLNSLADQALSIVSSVPRAWNGSDYTVYDTD